MSNDEFWTLVDSIHSEAEGDMDEKCGMLNSELRKLPVAEIVSFQTHLDDAMDRAYTWPLWAAAYIMNGGCGDDSFMDFRATLISMGQEIFEAALTDPESLTELELEDGEDFIYEGYQYVPSQVLEEVAPGKKFPRSKPSPKVPVGEKWDEDSVNDLYPLLVEKFAD
jgi:hypothetical protein